MRGIFGLVGVLVVLGVIVWFLQSGAGLDHTATVLKENEKARETLTQIAGRDATTGAPASASATLDPMPNNAGLLVTKVAADGAYARYFGLQRNDTIVALEFQGFRQNIKEIGDPELAKAQVMETFQKSGSVYVMRGGREVKLPEAKTPQPQAQPVAQQNATPSQQPNPAPTPPPERRSVMDRALAPIQSVPKDDQ